LPYLFKKNIFFIEESLAHDAEMSKFAPLKQKTLGKIEVW